MRALVAVFCAVAALAGASEAGAATYCVDVQRDGCTRFETLALALDRADDDAALDRIYVGPGTQTGPFADAAGAPVDIRGAGAARTTLAGGQGSGPTLSLRTAGSQVRDVAISGDTALALAGTSAQSLRLTVPSAGTGVLATSAQTGATLDGVVVSLGGAGATAFEADCATLSVRHASVTGSGAAGARGGCPAGDALVALGDSAFHGSFEPVEGTVTATTSWFDGAVPGDGNLTGTDPGFVAAGDPRLRPGSPLIDRGRAEPLASGEPQEDLGGWVRVVDGDGDGTPGRDIGAYELQPASLPLPEGNVLANGGAEAGAGSDGAPAGWMRTGAITSVAYGTMDADAPFPSLRAGEALGAGSAFFAGGAGPSSTLTQRIDLTGSAAQIDTGEGSAALSGLLGGYRLDEDRATVEAVFLDPDAARISSLRIGPVSAADRANATNLLFRSASGAIPKGTRAIDVVFAAERVGAAEETYTDAYADNLALVLSVPGAPSTQPIVPGEPIVADLKPFAGVTVLTARPLLRSRGSLRARVACASATVGRCTGTILLRGALPGRTTLSRLTAIGAFSLAPGARASVTLPLTATAKRLFKRRRSFAARFEVAAADGQGRRRATMVPVRVRRG